MVMNLVVVSFSTKIWMDEVNGNDQCTQIEHDISAVALGFFFSRLNPGRSCNADEERTTLNVMNSN